MAHHGPVLHVITSPAAAPCRDMWIALSHANRDEMKPLTTRHSATAIRSGRGRRRDSSPGRRLRHCYVWDNNDSEVSDTARKALDLGVALLIALARRREIAPLRMLYLAIAIDYPVRLPWFLLFRYRSDGRSGSRTRCCSPICGRRVSSMRSGQSAHSTTRFRARMSRSPSSSSPSGGCSRCDCATR